MSKNKKGAAPAEPVEVPPTPALPFDELRRIYDEIFEQFPTPVGKAISKREREETRSFQSRLTYGEIDFDSFGRDIFLYLSCLSSSRSSYSMYFACLCIYISHCVRQA